MGLVACAILFNLCVLRTEAVTVQSPNDSALHSQMVRWAEYQIDSGRIPLDGWYPDLALGSPHFHHYQSLPHILTAYLAGFSSGDRLLPWTLYLLLALWPAAVYWGARLLGLKKWESASAALISPLLASLPGYGYEFGSYTWRGLGLWSQLWGMWMLPLALGLSWRAVARRRSLALASLSVAMTIAFHFLTGYLALLAVGLSALLKPSELRTRIVRAAAVGVGAVLIASWVLVPLLTDNRWANQSVYVKGTFWTASFGARKVLAWLFTGRIFDSGRLPVLSLLVATGGVVCMRRARRSEPAVLVLALFGLSLLLYFGRPTLGAAMNLLPGGDELQPHRFIMGVHLAGILLGGIAVARIGRAVAVWLRSRTVVPATMITVILAGIGAAVLAPAWTERAAYARQGASWIEQQQVADATEVQDVLDLVARARTLGDGRYFAGLRSGWGRQDKLGFVPVYSVLASQDVDTVGYTLRTGSLSTDIEVLFDEGNLAQYNLFNIRYLILPVGRQPRVDARFVGRKGGHVLWTVETAGYMQVVDTTTPIAADRSSLSVTMGPFLGSDLLRRNVYPTVAFGGSPPALPTTIPSVDLEGPAGRVDWQAASPMDGVFRARVQATRKAVVLLKSSYDPRWRATVDGREAETQFIAPSFVGVAVAPGEHAILFRYEPYPHYPVLFFIGGATVLSLAAGPIFLARRRRLAMKRERRAPSGTQGCPPD